MTNAWVKYNVKLKKILQMCIIVATRSSEKLTDRFPKPSEWFKYENKLCDEMITQWLNPFIAKLNIVICQSSLADQLFAAAFNGFGK